MANLIYCLTKARMDGWVHDMHINGLTPFVLAKSADIPQAKAALAEGRNVVARATAGTVSGWRAPAGTEVTIDAELASARNGQLRAIAEQARGRVSESAGHDLGGATTAPLLQDPTRADRYGESQNVIVVTLAQLSARVAERSRVRQSQSPAACQDL